MLMPLARAAQPAAASTSCVAPWPCTRRARIRSRCSAARTAYEVLGVARDADAAAIKAAFRARLKLLHPDVNPSEDAAEATRELIAAFESLEVSALQDGGSGDPFEEPEGPATCVFVNELRCQGRRCASSCVAKAPRVFAFADDTGAARAVAQGEAGAAGDEYALRVAVGQCPTECIHFVTPRQLAVLEAELLRAREGRASLDEVGVALAELLARAAYENGRERGKKRTPKSTSRYVDFY